MKPHQRPRVGTRRDDRIRRIKSDSRPVYPGVDIAAPIDEDPGSQTAAQSALGDEPRLAPALDTGIAVQTRADRVAASAAKRQRVTLFGIAGAIVALTIAGVSWHGASDRMAALAPLAGLGSAPTTRTANSAAAAAPDDRRAATPIFATCKGLKLHLPVPVKSLTEIGFHQASYSWAIPMKTHMKDADMDKVAKTKSTNRDLDAQPEGPDGELTGQVLRMWRNRPGKPNTAVDVGAKPGTDVLAPVTGTVVRIKEYKLYGRYADYEMHIIPDNTTDIDVVLIHITDLQIEVGDRVNAGTTVVAKVRKLSDKFQDQLGRYTKGGGDHVHVQVNDSSAKGYKGLQGAVDPSEYPSSAPTDSL